MDRAHALVDPHNRYVVWWNARCGCTSAKTWYLHSLGFQIAPLPDRTLGIPVLGMSVHDVADKLATRIPFPSESSALLEVAIVRHPLARLVSHFQGFIGQQPTCCQLVNLEDSGASYSTFRQFVELVCDTPNCSLESHVAIQCLAWEGRRLTAMFKLEVIDLEWPFWLVRVKMPPQLFPRQNCRKQGADTSELLADVPMDTLDARYKGSFPSWRNYYDDKLKHAVRLKYAQDFQQLPYA